MPLEQMLDYTLAYLRIIASFTCFGYLKIHQNEKQYLAFLLFSMGELWRKFHSPYCQNQKPNQIFKNHSTSHQKVFQEIFIIITVIANGDSSLFHDF